MAPTTAPPAVDKPATDSLAAAKGLIVAKTAPVAPAPVPKPEVVKKAPPRVKRALPGTRRKKAKATDKSTTTTTTAAAQTPVNVYDAVLGEAEDLLQASMEAQALGRLKTSTAYSLLLHARLVGLGKRFDRSAQAQKEGGTATTTNNNSSSTQSTPTTEAMTEESSESPTTPETKKVQKELLAKILPQNVELDSAMMEHLARAAMELHHQRTGRRIQSDSIQAASSPLPPTNASIAWTEQERKQVQEALDAGKSDPAVIASSIKTRTEAQVRAYLRNTKERQKGSAQMEQEFATDENSMAGASPRRRGGRGRKPPTQAMNTVPNAKLDAKSLLEGKGL